MKTITNIRKEGECREESLGYIMRWKCCLGAMLSLVCLIFFSYETKAADSSNRIGSGATFLEFYLEDGFYRVDGQRVDLDVALEIENGRMLVPLRSVAEFLGCTVKWAQVTQQVTIVRDTKVVQLSAGSASAYVTDTGITTEIQMGVIPKLVNGYMLVPIRFIAESLDCQVYWDGAEKKVLIASVGPGGRKIGVDKMMTYLESMGKADTGEVVAIIDTGVDINHIYLQNRIVQAYNAVDGSANVYDEIGHGTKVAGIIANCTPETVKIMPIKVIDEKGMYTAETIVKAIDYAVEHGVKVINISLSAAAERDNRTVSEAVSEAIYQGCSIIVAAGNDGGNTSYYSPANVENAIVVTAVNENDMLWSNSNYGDTVVAAAPGVGVMSTIPGGKYSAGDGTSLAAPYVAAAVAMIRMDIAGITPVEIRNLLRDYSTDLGDPGWDARYGGGVVNLARYIACRKDGVIGDLTKSMEERTRELDEIIEAFRKEKLKEHIQLYGLFWNPLFATDLNVKAQELYGTKDFFAAGYYYEKALSFNAHDSTAKNNLAYMIRRGEYVSCHYTIRELLDEAKADGNPYAYVNEALLLAAKNQWEEADQTIKILCEKKVGRFFMDEIIKTWTRLSYQNDVEGDLVLGWLMRYSVYTDNQYTQSDYMERAVEKYPMLPEWIKLPANQL